MPGVQTLCVCVTGLSPHVTDQMLFAWFSHIGEVDTACVCAHMYTKQSLGFGFVNYKIHSDGQKAIDENDGALIRGQPIHVSWFLNASPDSSNAAVGTVRILQDYFRN